MGESIQLNLGQGLEVIRLFSCSTQLSTKFQLLIKTKIPTNEEVLLLIKTKIPTNEEVFCFKSLRCGIYHANKC